MTHLQISEIYASVQGESLWAGWPTVFVRTTGCPVRCVYCDTAYAFTGGTRMSFADIEQAVAALAIKRLCLTGGEPLAQPAAFALVRHFLDRGYTVSVETSGVRSIAGMPRPAKVVLDLKTPGSGVLNDWLPDNLGLLEAGDEIKTVVTSHDDWLWFRDWFARERARLPAGISVSVSPTIPGVNPAALTEWIVKSGLDVRLNLQIHKFIWPRETRGR